MSSTEIGDAARFKEQVRLDWTAGAEAWRKWRPQFVAQSSSATDLIVQAAQLTRGMQVLDVAGGTGEPALSLAAAVGPEGHVIATDLVPEMLAVAESSARERGVTNLSFRQADAEALPFPARRFDVVTCRFGLMFCLNAGQALREIRRVLKPGGRAAFIAWGPFDGNPYFTSTVGVFMEHVSLPPPPPGAPTPFTFAQPGTLTMAMQAAGFMQVEEDARTIPWVFPGSVPECWEFIREMTAPAFRRLFEALTPDQHAKVIKEVLDAIRHYDDGRQVNFPADIVIAPGVR